MRANQEIMKGYLKLNGIFFVRAFPFYFDLHLKLHCDKKVNADPSILASPCPCKEKNQTQAYHVFLQVLSWDFEGREG